MLNSDMEKVMEQAVATPSVADSAYQRIRTDIVFGALAPGERLRLDDLRNRYHVSVSTIREVLSRLLTEGMVHAENARGFEVAPISETEFKQIAELRYLLEAHALKDSFLAGDLRWESRIITAHHKLSSIEARMLDGETADQNLWKQYDREFHHSLISACGSNSLLETYSGTFDKFVRYQIIVLMFRGKPAAEEHKSLLECALNRDHERAKAVLRQHISACIDYSVEHACFLQLASR